MMKAVATAVDTAERTAGQAPVQPLYLEALTLVERLHRRLLDVIKDEFDRRGRADINSVQALLLYNIGDKELTAGELRTRGYYLGSNVSYNLKKLVELGFLDHQRSRVDRRSVRIRLTAQGQEIRRIVDALYQKHVKTVEQVGGISNEEFATLNKSLHRLERFWTDQIKQRSDFGQKFRRRLAHHPDAEGVAADAVAATAQTTEQAIQRYEGIVARGGWPNVPPTERLRLGNRHPSVVPLRKRLSPAGDLDASAGVTDVFDSYVEAAVRRFQARHGITVDGIVREQTFKALNIPAPVRLAQLKVNSGAAARPERQSRRAFRDVQYPRRADRGDRERRRRVAPHRRRRQARPAVARHQQQDRRDQLSIRIGPCRSRSCGAI